MPSKYHSIHKNDLARAMVAQSEQAFLAMAQGNAPQGATVKILEYKDMEPFFIKGGACDQLVELLARSTSQLQAGSPA
jgi:hypothetical protein